MKLEVGKKYRRRDGGIELIVGLPNHPLYKFKSARGNGYTEDGYFYREPPHNHPADLLSEIEEPVVNNSRHKHADLIIAWANGAKIQVMKPSSVEWIDCKFDPQWNPNCDYRIQPEPKPDRVSYINLVLGTLATKPHEKVSPDGPAGNNLKLIFDGETGKLKKAEVING